MIKGPKLPPYSHQTWGMCTIGDENKQQYPDHTQTADILKNQWQNFNKKKGSVLGKAYSKAPGQGVPFVLAFI